MSKLHELLAVDKNLKGQAMSCRTDLQNTFTKKQHHFGEKIVTFTPNKEGAEPVTESQSKLQTTVQAEVKWLSGIVGKQIDCSYAIDCANTTAKADITLDDGTVIAKDVPTTALLQLEHRLSEVLELAKAIPTLDPTKGFEPDVARGTGISQARQITKPRTQKVEKWITVIEPTKEHPGQAQKVSEDIVTGTIREQEWSSMITPATKGDILERAENLLRAVMQARSRANMQEVKPGDHKIAAALLDYIFQPVSA